MSHTQITSLLSGFILIFQPASSSQFHGIPPGNCLGSNFTRSEHDIVSGTVSSIGFRFRRRFLVQYYFKNRRNERYIVDTLPSQRTWRILSVIRCPCFTFTSVRRRIYICGGGGGGGHVGLDIYWPICKVGGHHFFLIFTPGLVVFRFLNCLNIHNFYFFHSAR